MATHLVVFAKHPVPGNVKTRLMARLAPEEAAAVYEGFIRDTLELADRSNAGRRILAYDPSDALDEMGALSPTGWDLEPQGEGDLGERMQRALEKGLREGADSSVLIGTDLPSLPHRYLDRAFEQLMDRDVVLGPSTDGGYYLIGLRSPFSEIFQGIEWSTPRVLAQTLARVRESGRSLGLLPPWYDVDTPDDLDFLLAHTEGRMSSGECDLLTHTKEAVRKMDEGGT